MSNVAPGALTRQELYDKIRETSKDEYILAEMKRLGFWKTNEDKPTEAESLIERRTALESELNALVRKQRMYENPEAALRALRKKRMEDAREKRAETRTKRADERHEKALDWHNRQQQEISWLGEAVSLGLGQKEGQAARLQKFDLPAFDTHKTLAKAMGITLNELRFLSYDRATSKVSHYKHFQIAKKTGGFRNISAPMPRLKRVQYWVLENILSKVPLHDAAHGFIGGRSILTNAQPHVGKDVVLNLDLKDFFPTISYRRVKGLFHQAGYSESLATVLALICCEPDVQEVEMDGEHYFVQQGERHLPQGAPTSPMISNIICRSLDRRLQGLATKYGFTYTRYADDLTFSGNEEARRAVKKLLWGVQNIVTAEGFVLHPDKTRIMGKGRKQEVTGLVVNERLSVDRKTIKAFRSLLHQASKNGLTGRTWNGSKTDKQLLRSMLGYANFVAMVLPEKGAGFKAKAQEIFLTHRAAMTADKPFKGVPKAEFRQLSAAGLEPLENWQQAREKAAPIREKTKDEIADERKARIKQRAADKKAAQGHNARGDVRRGNASASAIGGGFLAHAREEAGGRNASYGNPFQGLKKLNKKIKSALKPLKSLSSLTGLIYLVLFNRKKLEKVGICVVQMEMMIADTDFSGSHLAKPRKRQNQVQKFYDLTSEIYKKWRINSLISFLIYVMITYYLYTKTNSWGAMSAFFAVMTLFKIPDIWKRFVAVKKLNNWYEKSMNFIDAQIHDPWDLDDEDYDLVERPRSRNPLDEALSYQRHELDQKKKDWSVRLFDFIANIFRKK